MADAVLAQLSAIMAWFASRDENYTSPIVKGMRRNTNAKPRDRVLSDAELRLVWEACADFAMFGRFIKLLVLSAQRRDKVATMRWDDITDGVWTIRSEEREKGNADMLRLPPVALDILNSQGRVAGNPHVFAGRGGKAFNSFSENVDALRAKLPAEMRDWTLHDLRRTSRSLLSRAGVLPHVSERVLGYVMPGVEGVYDRHHYQQEKADALARLANVIARIINPSDDNVIPLAGRPHPLRGRCESPDVLRHEQNHGYNYDGQHSHLHPKVIHQAAGLVIALHGHE